MLYLFSSIFRQFAIGCVPFIISEHLLDHRVLGYSSFISLFLDLYRLCNMDIISKVQQVICFAFHDSKLIMETCQEAKNLRKIVTLFYLD